MRDIKEDETELYTPLTVQLATALLDKDDK